MRLRITRNPTGAGLTFELLDGGDTLLRSRGYADRKLCTQGMQELIERLADAEHFNIDEGRASGQVHLQITAPSGGVLASSAPLPTVQAAAELRDTIIAKASVRASYEVLVAEPEVSGALAVLPFQRKIGDLRLLYDFAWSSLSGLAGFECFHRAERGLYYFHFNGPGGAAILYSRGFDSGPRRDSRLRSVVESAAMRQRCERIADDGLRFIVKARNGQEIARSHAYVSEAEREAAIDFVLAHVARFGEAYVRDHEGRSAVRSKYRLELGETTASAGFQLLRGKDDRLYYFVFGDDEGRALLFSQGYRNRGGRDNGVRSLIRNGSVEDRSEILHEAEGFYFIVRAANHQELGRSAWFPDKAAAAAALHLLRLRLPQWAEQFCVEPSPKTKGQVSAFVLSVGRRLENGDLPPATMLVAPPSLHPSELPPPPPPAAPPSPAPPPPPAAAPPPLPPAPPPASSIEVPRPVRQPPPGRGSSSPTEEPASGGPIRRPTPAWLPIGAGLVCSILGLYLFSVYAPRPSDPPEMLLQPPDSAPGIGPQDGSSAARSHAALALAVPDAAVSADAASPATLAMAPPVPAPGAAPRLPIPGHPEIALLPGSMEAQLLEYLRSPVTEPRTFTMNRLRYPPNSHEMNDQGQEQTYLLGLLLLVFPNVTIEIHGHSDPSEYETYSGPKPYLGYTLSKLRADCVYRRIIHQGVSADRMRIQGHAATRPITTGETNEGRQQNRRVEIVVKPRG